jgi:hypothetical protein
MHYMHSSDLMNIRLHRKYLLIYLKFEFKCLFDSQPLYTRSIKDFYHNILNSQIYFKLKNISYSSHKLSSSDIFYIVSILNYNLCIC